MSGVRLAFLHCVYSTVEAVNLASREASYRSTTVASGAGLRYREAAVSMLKMMPPALSPALVLFLARSTTSAMHTRGADTVQ